MTFALLDVLLPIEELNKISDMFAFYRILGFCAIGVINAILMIVVSYKFFQAIQQCNYKSGEYIKWLRKRDNPFISRLLMLSMLSILGFLLINMSLSFIDHFIVKYAGFFVYFLFLAVYFANERKEKSKVPLVYTKRMWRLIITFALLTVILSLLLIFSVNLVAIPFSENLLSKFRYAILCLSPIAVPYLVLFAYKINQPIEKKINKKYFDECKDTLSKRSDLIKIGVTGSYGKTSVKNVLQSILSKKYEVLATPESYNTPMGIVKTVKRLEDKHQILICEMGARQVGDIDELCSLVSLDYAVITGITRQHLETFLTLENVIKTKSEILKGVKKSAFISADDKYSIEIYKNAKCDKYLAGANKTKNSYLYAENVSFSELGTNFTLVFGDNKVDVKTSLLGKGAVSNIMLASAVALNFGITLDEIKEAIENLKQIPHRLELIKGANGVYVLDDGYNSNPEGFKTAIELLKSFKGKKYVVTPGMVELGHAQSGLNYKMGELLSTVCDGVILVGRSGSLQIREGLLCKDYPKEKIFMVKNLTEAKELFPSLLNSGDVVLFENDLPDIFN